MNKYVAKGAIHVGRWVISQGNASLAEMVISLLWKMTKEATRDGIDPDHGLKKRIGGESIRREGEVQVLTGIEAAPRRPRNV